MTPSLVEPTKKPTASPAAFLPGLTSASFNHGGPLARKLISGTFPDESLLREGHDPWDQDSKFHGQETGSFGSKSPDNKETRSCTQSADDSMRYDVEKT